MTWLLKHVCTHLTIQNRQPAYRINARHLRTLARALLEELLPARPYEIGIYLVGSKQICRLNETFLGHEGVTDVIAFDYTELLDESGPMRDPSPRPSPLMKGRGRIDAYLFAKPRFMVPMHALERTEAFHERSTSELPPSPREGRAGRGPGRGAVLKRDSSPQHSPADKDRAERVRRRSGELHGEIFICVAEAVTQAREFRTTWQAELVRYAVHGLLHLLGHDDSRPGPRRRMKREEDRLLHLLTARFDLRAL